MEPNKVYYQKMQMMGVILIIGKIISLKIRASKIAKKIKVADKRQYYKILISNNILFHFQAIEKKSFEKLYKK